MYYSLESMAEFEDSPDEWLERRSGEEREEFNIKLENDETVEFSIISDLRQHPAAKIGSGAFYHPRDRRIYLNSNSSGHPLNAGVHEQEHVRQAFLYPGFDQITSDVTETLDNLGLIEVSDCGDFDEVITTMEDINISNTKLGEDLVDLGYSKDSLATLVTSEEDVANSIHELQEYYPEDRGSEGWLENVMELVQTIEDSSPEDGIMRTKENSIDAEKEAFAYFIGEYVEAKNSNYYYNSTLDGINISAPIHHAYDQKI